MEEGDDEEEEDDDHPNKKLKPNLDEKSSVFQDVTFSATGTMSVVRKQIIEWVENNGGEFSKSVTK